MMAPPSPTLSTHFSAYLATSVVLRDNKPGDGLTFLNILNPNSANKHGRKPSWASSGGQSSLKGTEPDHSAIGLNTLHCATSAATSLTAASPTQTHMDELLVRSGKGSGSWSYSAQPS